MTTYVIVDNDGHYTVDVVAVETSSDGTRHEIALATLKPGEKTAERQVTFWAGRHIEVRECQPMRKD
jgi:hypothetical protein